MPRLRLFSALAAGVIASNAAAAQWEAHPGGGDRIVVHVFRKGALAVFAHDHHFEVTRWGAAASFPDEQPSSASVDVVVASDSLRDRQERLSDEDREKVDRQAAGPEVLDSQHHPRIEFRSQRFDADPGSTSQRVHGNLHGTLTIRGQSVPATIAVDADRADGAWRVRGKARVKQTAFGIKPFSGFAGTVSVKDELEIELAVTLRPRG